MSQTFFKTKYPFTIIHNECGGVAFHSRVLPRAGMIMQARDCAYDVTSWPSPHTDIKCFNCKRILTTPLAKNCSVKLR